MLLTVIATNVLIDPMGVFETNLLPPSENANHSYQRLLTYQAAPQRFDGLYFGSSRAGNVSLGELSRRMNVSFADFRLPGSVLSDYLPLADFVLAQKQSRGEQLRGVFILLDIDTFGLPPNRSLSVLLPPAVGGMSTVRFWWSNLTTVQLRVWLSAIREARSKWHSDRATAPWWIRVVRQMAARIQAEAAGQAYAQPIKKPPAALNPILAAAGEVPPISITKRAYFSSELQKLQRLVDLCRNHKVELIVALTPLSRRNESYLDPSSEAAAIARISQITPLWDFTNSGELTDQPGLWSDESHFDSAIGDLILKKIFREDVPPEWSSFGRFRKSVDAHPAPATAR